MVKIKYHSSPVRVSLTGVLFFIILSCTGAPGKVSADDIKKPAITVNWRYYITKKNEGTRSESRGHYLELNGKIFPDVFSLMAIGNKLYRFESRDQLWGDDGYVLSEVTFKPVINREIISEKDKHAGFYKGLEKKNGTPEQWIYVERDDIKAWVDPLRYKKFLENNPLKPLQRFKMLRFQK